MSLSGKKVVVFGGAGALGSAVVARLVSDGAEVASADVVAPSGERRHEGADYAQLDVLDEGEVAAFLEGLPGDLWGAVNVVGGYEAGQAVAELDLSSLQGQLDLNFVSAVQVTKHALARLTRQGGGGRVVHTSSRAAVGDGKMALPYSISKLGVVRLVEASAAEVRDLGICVNCIMPSVIDTPANRASMPSSDHSRWPKPHEIAGVISFLLSDDAVLISGAAIPVYGRA